MRHQRQPRVICEDGYAFAALDLPIRLDVFCVHVHTSNVIGALHRVLNPDVAPRYLAAPPTFHAHVVMLDERDAVNRRLKLFARETSQPHTRLLAILQINRVRLAAGCVDFQHIHPE